MIGSRLKAAAILKVDKIALDCTKSRNSASASDLNRFEYSQRLETPIRVHAQHGLA